MVSQITESDTKILLDALLDHVTDHSFLCFRCPRCQLYFYSDSELASHINTDAHLVKARKHYLGRIEKLQRKTLKKLKDQKPNENSRQPPPAELNEAVTEGKCSTCQSIVLQKGLSESACCRSCRFLRRSKKKGEFLCKVCGVGMAGIRGAKVHVEVAHFTNRCKKKVNW